MNNNLLYIILQACNYSSTLSEIANKLYFSQPYISKVLKKAEKEYDTVLVNRKETPITLTKSGLLVLEHLQIIHEAKLDLKKALLQDKANQERALNILVTNPFLYPIVLDILTRHSQEDSDFYFNLSSSPIAESTIKIIANHHFDLIIGRKYIDSSLITLALPRNPVYVFISSHCQIYDRHQQFLPFISKYLDGMKESTFVLFENSAGVQDYINKRFNEVGIHITKAIQVESVIDAINTAISLGHKGMALTNQYIAKKLFPANDYNLLNLPKNTLNFDNAIMYEKGANEQINDLANFLKINLSKIIN